MLLCCTALHLNNTMHHVMQWICNFPTYVDCFGSHCGVYITVLARGVIIYHYLRSINHPLGVWRSVENHPTGVELIMSTDPRNNTPPTKWLRFICLGRSRARQSRGKHPAVVTSIGTSSQAAQPDAKGIGPGSQSSPSPPADKETIHQWTKITFKLSEKVD